MVIVGLVGFGFYLSPKTSYGVTINKETYAINESILLTSSGGALELYDLDFPEFVDDSVADSHEVGDNVSFGRAGDFALVEVNEPQACDGYELSYQECKDSEYFVGEVLFTVLPPSGGGAPSGGGGSVSNTGPRVSILEPNRSAKNLKGEVVIKYEAYDQDDQRGLGQSFGLIEEPVSIYYFSGINIREYILIAENLPAEGEYKWDVSDLPEGDIYIVIKVIDKKGLTDSALSDQLVVDNSAPIFKLTTTPEATRGESVEITIEPSEELFGLPDLFVVQRGHSPVKVKLQTLGDNLFSGTYKPVPGFDGLALLDVSGQDLNKNLGTTTISGGFFSVGVEPPPKPVITSPLDNEIVATNTIEVLGGNVRDDLTLSLFVNNKDSYEATPDADGNFRFTGVLVDKDFNKGNNFLRLVASDLAGNQTEIALGVKFNLNPEIDFVSPVAGQILTGTSSLQVAGSDANGDVLKYSFEISRNNSNVFSSLAKKLTTGSYTFDSSLFADGDYVARVVADDNFGKSYATSSVFTIRNELPIITFVGGDRQIVNTKKTALGFSVQDSQVPVGDIDNPTIKSYPVTKVEYSLDEGVTWQSMQSPRSGNFTINLDTTEEKSYTVLVRALDERKFYGRAKALIIADFGAPTEAVLTSPTDGAIFGKKDDQNKKLAGTQITLVGKAEPESTVIATTNRFTVSTEVDSKGDFILPDVSLTKHGANSILITVVDLAGNKSFGQTLTLQSNNAPEVKFISPREGRGLGNNTKIVWETRDQDLDKVKTNSLKIRKAGSTSFTTIATDITKEEYDWQLPQNMSSGNYELVVEVTDGVSVSVASVSIAVDRVPPVIKSFNLGQSIITEAVAIRGVGEASDDLSGIEFAEYSFAGDEWQSADILSGFLSNNASFGFVRQSGLVDGEYQVKARVKDGAGNVSSVFPVKLLIDTTAPRVGSIAFTQNGSFLEPDSDGSFLVGSNSTLELSVSLESDTKNATATLGSYVFPLSRYQNNLWQAGVVLSEVDDYEIFVEAEDQFDHKTLPQNVGVLKVIPSGQIWYQDSQGLPHPLAGAQIEVWVVDLKTNEYSLWQAESFGAVNPIVVGDDGRYSLRLPVGTYELRITALGFERLKTKPFVTRQPSLINNDFQMVERSGFVGWLKNLID